MANIMDELGIKPSSAVSQRNIKMMFWGATATRKTETVLRNLPHVLLIDSEGNGVQCVDMPEIPEFLYAPTKDVLKAKKIIIAAAEGKLKFPDAALVETVCVDSASVLWSVQQEVAGTLAENRAEKYHQPTAGATVTMKDWGSAKRPLKALYTAVNNSGIKYLVFICREKDLMDEAGEKKIGFTWDGMKGLDYEMNLALRFSYTPAKKWQYETTKVQGSLAKLFPMGKTGSEIDFKALFDYAARIKPSAGEEEEESDIAKRIAGASEKSAPKASQADLVVLARNHGIDAKKLGEILKAAGFSAYVPEKHVEMEQAILNYAESIA